MKTLLINASPKKKLSVSGYFLWLQRALIGGEAQRETLRNRNDHARILQGLQGVDAVVFSLPLYVDSVPSHVLAFLQEMETYCKENRLAPKLYVISNGGFIEGKQNRPLMRVFENFCARCGAVWGGGIGIGGGVMLNVMRILFWVFTGLLGLNLLLNGLESGNWLPSAAFTTFLTQVAEILFFHLGVLFCMMRMGCAIRKGNVIQTQYTRVLLPSFVFILVADVFFLLVSVFEGGLFRGWLSKK